jgi:hypothetical protein
MLRMLRRLIGENIALTWQAATDLQPLPATAYQYGGCTDGAEGGSKTDREWCGKK